MEEWKEYKLGEVLSVRYGKDYDDLAEGDYPVFGSGGYMCSVSKYLYDRPSVLIPRVGTLNNVIYVSEPFWTVNTMFWTEINEDIVIPKFLYYIIHAFDFSSMNLGSAVPRLNKSLIESIEVRIPSIGTQQEVVEKLFPIDDKIVINQRINDNFTLPFLLLTCFVLWLLKLRNDNLEQQAQVLFKSWFVDFEPFKDGEFVESEMGMIPKGWRVKSLSGIADYRNGLAMQKFRPLDGEIGLPVLKIKELGQGLCDDSSELCSPSMIGEKYIINDGDIIFSWSGTLMVKLWCGGKCGLNQHLFLVDPQGFPNWFVYQWTKHHLDNFIRIAKDKAVTMGHIKRGELDKAKVVVPDEKSMCDINALMEPLFKQIIASQIESRYLAQLRDTLLPRLMSGELKVNDLETIK